MAKGVKQIAMNLSGGGISDTHVGNTSFKRPQYATLGETAPIISFISCDMRQIAFNLQSGGDAITITCNLKNQGPRNILPPKTTRYKTAFIVIDETDTDKLSQRRLPHADEPSL